MSVSTTIQTALIKTSEVVGADIFDRAGHKIATIRELFIDPASGQIHFAIAEIAALLGSGGKYHPVPWSALQWDAAKSAYVAPFDPRRFASRWRTSKEKLKAAPSYDREQINSNAYGWDTQVQGYYGS